MNLSKLVNIINSTELLNYPRSGGTDEWKIGKFILFLDKKSPSSINSNMLRIPNKLKTEKLFVCFLVYVAASVQLSFSFLIFLMKYMWGIAEQSPVGAL